MKIDWQSMYDEAMSKVKRLEAERDAFIVGVESACTPDEDIRPERRRILENDPNAYSMFQLVRQELRKRDERADAAEAKLAALVEALDDAMDGSTLVLDSAKVNRLMSVRADLSEAARERDESIRREAVRNHQAQAKRMLVAMGPHIPGCWREHLEEMAGERVMQGLRDPKGGE